MTVFVEKMTKFIKKQMVTMKMNICNWLKYNHFDDNHDHVV